MSPDSEDTAFEEALRGDLPSSQTSARLRRRLLAAGIAVGNGVAVTSAAAASASPGVVAGLVSKGLALSWGVKLGVLAVVAIPSVGLLVESQSEPQLAVPPPNVVDPIRPARSPERSPPVVTPVQSNLHDQRTQSAPAAPAATVRGTMAAATPTDTTASSPSQGDFASAEAAVAARASTLAEETRILDSALAELAAGHSLRAAELIAEHQRRFPVGLLQQERERARARLNEMSRGK